MTLREALLDAARRLEIHRVSNPRLTAEVLLAHCMSVDRTYLYTHDDRILQDEERRRFEHALRQRISGVPLQYIVGRQEFYGREFVVNPSVLIPRPETEFVVESVLEVHRELPELHSAHGVSIIDVGAGSGCIGLTLALELPTAAVILADVSIEALRVAQTNARNLSARALFVCMDALDAVTGPFDFVVSNPPYVSPRDAAGLQREVREYEPPVAFFAPEEGMAFIRRLVESAERLLKPGGFLVMEIGFGMEERVGSLFGPRWERRPAKLDLQGIPRVVIARMKPRVGHPPA